MTIYRKLVGNEGPVLSGHVGIKSSVSAGRRGVEGKRTTTEKGAGFVYDDYIAASLPRL